MYKCEKKTTGRRIKLYTQVKEVEFGVVLVIFIDTNE